MLLGACAAGDQQPAPTQTPAATAAASVPTAALAPATVPAVTSPTADQTPTPQLDIPTVPPTITAAPTATPFPLQAGWWDDAVCYEIFVRSFYDSDGDGIGDLNGLIQKLDYINDGDPKTARDLGATCIWLMPIMPSPSYHGYDVTDYYAVNPQYGTSDDFKRLVAEAHRRGIKVLIDLVLNHTSREHPWFQEALTDPASPHRDWYVWSKDNPGYAGPDGQQVWHKSPLRDEYYYGVFSDAMPDLNYRTPAVTEEARKISLFWREQMGVDGFRLDAVRHLVENGRRQVDTRETHAWLRDFQAFLDKESPGAYTIGEIFGGSGDTLGAYYPDQLDMYFEFQIGKTLVPAADYGAVDALRRAIQVAGQNLPFQRWAPFLTNHDQNRVMGSFGGDPAKAKIAATALLSLPGLPFVYYGEEIGMVGDKPDEQIRTPMQWSGSDGGGFSAGAPWEPLPPSYAQVNVAAQERDPGSLLNTYRRMIQLHTSSPALAHGSLALASASNAKVLAFVRQAGDSAVLVVLNFDEAAADGVTISLDRSELAPATYQARPLLGKDAGAPLAVGDGGAIAGYAPLPSLGPRTGYLFALTR
ncbi:MAG: alpha-amylase [Kouleothrix sp.]|nr:alpha-amylase [Kouleothrix sp.]